MKASHRRYYEKRYGELYKRAEGIPFSECVYCGSPRQCLDHCPPISRLEYIDVQKAIDQGLKFILYPACMECNMRLSSKMSIDLYDRMSILADIYMDKADKIELWTESEIEQMGPNLKSVIISSSNKAKFYAERARKILDRLDDLQGIIHGE